MSVAFGGATVAWFLNLVGGFDFVRFASDHVKAELPLLVWLLGATTSLAVLMCTYWYFVSFPSEVSPMPGHRVLLNFTLLGGLVCSATAYDHNPALWLGAQALAIPFGLNVPRAMRPRDEGELRAMEVALYGAVYSVAALPTVVLWRTLGADHRVVVPLLCAIFALPWVGMLPTILYVSRGRRAFERRERPQTLVGPRFWKSRITRLSWVGWIVSSPMLFWVDELLLGALLYVVVQALYAPVFIENRQVLRAHRQRLECREAGPLLPRGHPDDAARG